MRRVQTGILSTLLYADLFDYPLREHELWKYFIGKKITYTSFRSALEQLVKEKQVFIAKDFYTLPNRSQLITQRLKRHKSGIKKIAYAQKVAKLLTSIPSVWGVGISGALAMHNAPYDDDIDLFIITAPRTLWLTRLLSIMLLDILHMRRKPGQRAVKNKLCLNMFMEGSGLQLPKKEQDLYSAHEVVQLKPLINKYKTYERFLYANRWTKEYLPHAIKTPPKPLPMSIPDRGMLDFFELVCERFQRWYMRSRHTTEVIRKDMVRFHPEDARYWVLKKFNDQKKRLLH